MLTALAPLPTTTGVVLVGMPAVPDIVAVAVALSPPALAGSTLSGTPSQVEFGAIGHSSAWQMLWS